MGGIMEQGGGSKENRLSLSPEKVAGSSRWHSREIKPEKSEHEEGHVAPGRGKTHSTRVSSQKKKLNITIYGLDLAFYFCNLLARVCKMRPLWTQC
jgi:hypothetical protein